MNLTPLLIPKNYYPLARRGADNPRSKLGDLSPGCPLYLKTNKTINHLKSLKIFFQTNVLLTSCTANIFNVIFTVFKCVPISNIISLYGLHLIAAISGIIVKLIYSFFTVTSTLDKSLKWQ